MNLGEPRLVALDTETSGLWPDEGARVATVSIAWAGMNRLALPFDQGVRDKLPVNQLTLWGDGPDPNLSERDWNELCAWLLECDIVMHNAKFDIAMMRVGTRHWYGVDLADRVVWDTMLAAKELDPLQLVSLDAAAQRANVGQKQGKKEIDAWLKAQRYPAGRYDLAPWELVEPYAAADAEMTLMLHRHQQGRLAVEGATEAKILRELQLTKVLTDIEARGVPYDCHGSLEAAAVLEQRAAEIEAALPWSEGSGGVSGAARYFFETQGVSALRLLASGKPSLDEEQTRQMVKDGVPGAAEWAELSALRRALSMWYLGYPAKAGPDGRLRCSYRQTKVVSGRMSVERVQLQAIPKEDKAAKLGLAGAEVPTIRQLIARGVGKGRALRNLDLQQAELRIAAKYAGCETILQALRDGTDFHGDTTEKVLGVARGAPNFKSMRDIGKRLTFASIFQVGGETFQTNLKRLADIDMPLHEANQLVMRWRATYPEFTDAYRKAERKVQRDRWVRLLGGTQYECKSWFADHEQEHTAWSRMVQGSLAEFLKLWLIETEEGWPGVVVLNVHDSLLIEADEDEVDGIAQAIALDGAILGEDVFGVPMPIEYGTWSANASYSR